MFIKLKKSFNIKRKSFKPYSCTNLNYTKQVLFISIHMTWSVTESSDIKWLTILTDSMRSYSEWFTRLIQMVSLWGFFSNSLKNWFTISHYASCATCLHLKYNFKFNKDYKISSGNIARSAFIQNNQLNNILPPTQTEHKPLLKVCS